jgi:hypothetical protein
MLLLKLMRVVNAYNTHLSLFQYYNNFYFNNKIYLFSKIKSEDEFLIRVDYPSKASTGSQSALSKDYSD